MLIRFVTILQYLQICSHYVIHLKITLYVSHTSAFLKKKRIKKEISQISLSLSHTHIHTHTHAHTHTQITALGQLQKHAFLRQKLWNHKIIQDIAAEAKLGLY